MSLQAFRRAMEDGDPDAIRATLAEDVVLHSPVTSRPFHGRDLVTALLAAARATLEGLAYESELDGDGLHALTFAGAVAGRPASGVDLVVLDDDGLVRDFTAMIRPLGAARAFNEGMGQRVGHLVAEASGTAGASGSAAGAEPKRG